MSSIVVSPSSFDDAVRDALDSYNGYIVDSMKEAAEKAAKQANQEIKAHITFHERSGKYVRAFKVKKIKQGNSYVQYAWYVDAPHYRLTHLLEKGHKTRYKRSGKRMASAFPHIEYGEKIARMVFEQELVEAVNKK